MRGLFVTGTGTGVGKTILSAALIAAMRAAGEPVRAHKPVVTGLAEPPGDWPPDHELLALTSGMRPDEVAPLRFWPAVSPHLAATLADRHIEADTLVEQAKAAAGTSDTLILEGVGGLLVPLAEDFTVRDLAVELGLPLLIAASPGLGTINHTLLTIAAARAAGLDVSAVVLTPWPAEPSVMEPSNRDAIVRLGDVEVTTLGAVQRPQLAGGVPHPDLGELAEAGARLPWRRWLAEQSNV